MAIINRSDAWLLEVSIDDHGRLKTINNLWILNPSDIRDFSSSSAS